MRLSDRGQLLPFAISFLARLINSGVSTTVTIGGIDIQILYSPLDYAIQALFERRRRTACRSSCLGLGNLRLKAQFSGCE